MTGLTKRCSSLVVLVLLLSPLSVASQRTDNQEGEREGAREGNGARVWDWGKKEKYDKKFKEMLKTVGICIRKDVQRIGSGISVCGISVCSLKI